MGDFVLTSIAQGEYGPENIDWGTFCQTVYDDAKRSAPDDKDYLRRQIIRSMRFLRNKDLVINEATIYFWVVDGVTRYPRRVAWRYDPDLSTPDIPSDDSVYFPGDVISPRVLTLRQENSTFWSDPIDIVTMDDIRRYSLDDSSQGHPQVVAPWNDGAYFYPSPSENFLVRMDYIRDLGIPSYSYDAENGYQFYEPFTGLPLADSWTGDWLNRADDLVRSYALYLAFTDRYQDKDGAKSQFSLYLQALNRLRAESSKTKARVKRRVSRV